MIYSVIREFDELTPQEVVQHADAVKAAKIKELKAWNELKVYALEQKGSAPNCIKS